jgi:hypothetical protein
MYYYQSYLILNRPANFLAKPPHIYAASDSKVTWQAGVPGMTGMSSGTFLFIASAVTDGEPVAQQPSSAPIGASAANTDPASVH